MALDNKSVGSRTDSVCIKRWISLGWKRRYDLKKELGDLSDWKENMFT